jgi:hypothetical protein
VKGGAVLLLCRNQLKLYKEGKMILVRWFSDAFKSGVGFLTKAGDARIIGLGALTNTVHIFRDTGVAWILNPMAASLTDIWFSKVEGCVMNSANVGTQRIHLDLIGKRQTCRKTASPTPYLQAEFFVSSFILKHELSAPFATVGIQFYFPDR